MYWPTATDRPMVIAQLTVSLVADEDLEEGAIKMMVFEIKINSKVNRQCDLLIQSYDFIKLARDRNMLKIMPIVEDLVFSSYTVFVLCWLLAVGQYWGHCGLSNDLGSSLQPEVVNTLRPRQDGRHFADDIFTCNFFNEKCCILIKFSLKYVRKGPIDNNAALVQIMAWRRSGDKPLSETMMISLPTHICVTRPQWVNEATMTENEVSISSLL